MKRNLNDWLKGYLEYTRKTESSPIFHKWVGISVLASALQKKTWFELGRFNIYPNMYIVLVAEPGQCRKSQAISYGEKLMKEVEGIILTSQATTPEALLLSLEQSTQTHPMENGTSMQHSSVTVSSSEFEVFMGQKKENNKFLTILTDLWDASEHPWEYKTKTSGSTVIPSVFVNLISGTTPESLASVLPPTAVGGGLTSRIMFVYSDRPGRPRPIPERPPKKLVDALVQDLASITKISGPFSFSKESEEWWNDWYVNSYLNYEGRICKDKSFAGWYSRKTTFVVKVAQMLSTACSDKREIDVKFFENSLEMIEEAEQYMANAFVAVGKSKISAEFNEVKEYIKARGAVAESAIIRDLWAGVSMDLAAVRESIETLKAGGVIKEEYRAEAGSFKKKTFFVWTGGEDASKENHCRTRQEE